MKSYLDNVVNDQRPLFVTRANGEDVAVLSKSDYEGLQETYYLMSSPKNAERLQKALKELDEGKGAQEN